MVLVKSLTRQNGVHLGTGTCSALLKNYIFKLKYMATCSWGDTQQITLHLISENCNLRS